MTSAFHASFSSTIDAVRTCSSTTVIIFYYYYCDLTTTTTSYFAAVRPGEKMAAEDKSVVFPSNEDFDDVHDEINKLVSVPLDRPFRILAVKEITCRSTFSSSDRTVSPERVSRIAKLCDTDGAVMTVWLPGTLEKQLMTFSEEDVAGGRLFIRSLGPKVSETTGHTYQNFRILKSQ